MGVKGGSILQFESSFNGVQICFRRGYEFTTKTAPVIPSAIAYMSSVYGIGSVSEAGLSQTKTLEARNMKQHARQLLE